MTWNIYVKIGRLEVGRGNRSLLFICVFFVLLFSCNRRNNNISPVVECFETNISVDQEIGMEYASAKDVSLLIETFSDKKDDFLPFSVRYVNAKNGLERRDSPSISGAILGKLLHGSRITVIERSDIKETVEGISDYWYLCRGGTSTGIGGRYWVFGGFLTTTLPEDTIPLLGLWDTDRIGHRGRDEYWFFWPDNTVQTGTNETSTGFRGSWVLTDYMLTIEKRPIIFEGTVEIVLQEITVEIINRDKIIFHFANGTREILTRSNELF